jgi:imidazolonepropionase-like amidohydrolase
MRSSCVHRLVFALGFAVFFHVPVAQAEEQRLAITGARLYSSPDSQPITDAVILVEGSKIKAVGPASSISIPPSYRLLQLSGATVTAGFWNSHVHLVAPPFLRASAAEDSEVQAELARAFTRWGFTTVFDLASTMEIARSVKARIASRRVLGPRVLSVGDPFYPAGATPVYARAFYEQFNLPNAEVASPETGADRARRQLRDGADGLKLFTGSIVGGEDGVEHMPVNVATAVVRAAHGQGKRVFAHPTDRAGMDVAIRSGVDVLAHSAPLMGRWTKEDAERIADAKMAVVPTLALFADNPHPATPVAVAVQQVSMLQRAGGTILFGTDAGFTENFDTRQELSLLSDAIGWRGVLASLTTNPAAFFGEGASRGRLVAGYRADLVVLKGDPEKDVSALACVTMVLRDGELVYSRERDPDPQRC